MLPNDSPTKNLLIESARAMQSLAQEVVENCRAGDMLLLSGDLGAGKTTFTQGVAKALGITDAVTSPTFTIVGEYKVVGHPSIQRFIHIDLYRLAKSSIETDTMLPEFLASTSREHALTVVEWAERLPSTPSGTVFKVHFSHGEKPDQRNVVLDARLSSRAL